MSQEMYEIKGSYPQGQELDWADREALSTSEHFLSIEGLANWDLPDFDWYKLNCVVADGLRKARALREEVINLVNQTITAEMKRCKYLPEHVPEWEFPDFSQAVIEDLMNAIDVEEKKKERIMNPSDQLEKMIEFHNQLQKTNFYGTIIQVWKDGEIVALKKEETFQGKDFFSITFQYNTK